MLGELIYEVEPLREPLPSLPGARRWMAVHAKAHGVRVDGSRDTIPLSGF